MTYNNMECVDVGTENCPCYLAETEDCIVCSRLAGRDYCDCNWSGVCVYNEYIQNGGRALVKRENRRARILRKIYYGQDKLVLVLDVPKGFALKAGQPGAFIFVNVVGGRDFSNVPVSIMRSDAERGEIYIALQIISGKTKAIAEQEERLMIRGVYRNGLLGRGVVHLTEDAGICKTHRSEAYGEPQWVIITRGMGFAPAVNLLEWAGGKVKTLLLTDEEKAGRELLRDYLEAAAGGDKVEIKKVSLAKEPEVCCREIEEFGYDRIFLMVSEHYIERIREHIDIPREKLVYSNVFRMCCGEGVCGACSCTDENGMTKKMCKCRDLK